MDLFSGLLKLDACFTGLLVNDILSYSESECLFKVHSVFRKAVNIYAADNLISVVSQSAGKAASYIVVSQNIDFLSLNLKAGDEVILENRGLIFDNFSVNFDNAQIWKDIIDNSFRFTKSKISCDNLRIFKSTIDRLAAQNSAWEKCLKDKAFNERIKKLTEKNPAEAVKGLIGLGPGLTPTGDDVLLGFMAVVNSCDDYISIRSSFKEEILSNLKNTSDISASFLKMAAEKHYHEYVQEVLYSMIWGIPENVSISVRKLLKIGATSGTDISTGMYFGFL